MCGCHGGALVLHDNQSTEYRGRGARTLCTQGLLIRLTAGHVGTHTRHHAGTPTHTHTHVCFIIPPMCHFHVLMGVSVRLCSQVILLREELFV